ncbi:unnamed protein product [Closterium sp. Yama58-4]|nr:unnamed protein product [Closterium sp. Yama58-4]
MLKRTHSALVIRLPPLHAAKAALGFTVFGVLALLAPLRLMLTKQPSLWHFWQLDPLVAALCTPGCGVWCDGVNPTEKKQPPIVPVASPLCARLLVFIWCSPFLLLLLAIKSLCLAFETRTVQIDGSQLLHTLQLFDCTINTTISTASIVRVDLCKMEWPFCSRCFCRVAAADGKKIDFGGSLSREENVWLQLEVPSFLLSLAAGSA